MCTSMYVHIHIICIYIYIEIESWFWIHWIILRSYKMWWIYWISPNNLCFHQLHGWKRPPFASTIFPMLSPWTRCPAQKPGEKNSCPSWILHIIYTWKYTNISIMMCIYRYIMIYTRVYIYMYRYMCIYIHTCI